MERVVESGDPMSVAYWCAAFCCTERELLAAIDELGTSDAGAVGAYLAEAGKRAHS